MRSVKFFAVFLIILGNLFPIIVWAIEIIPSETANLTNKKTLLEIKNSNLTNIFLNENSSANVLASKNLAIKTKEDLRLKNILAKWKNKQLKKWENLPENSFLINASAYTASADECGNDKGITASGVKAKVKYTLACPQEFPFGVKVEIENLGTFVCEDRGGKIKGNKFDIFVKNKKEALDFGRQNLHAKIIS